MEDLPGSVIQGILSRTEALDCVRATFVSKRWRALASDDSVWSQHCFNAFGVSAPTDPEGNPCSSFKETYSTWYQGYHRYGCYVRRAKRLWDDLKGFLTSSYSAIEESLCEGVCEAELDQAEEQLGWKLPEHARVLYRICDGQEIEVDTDNSSEYLGMLGGYYFYNHFVNVQLLPLRQVVGYTRRLAPKLRGTKRVVVAASCNLNKFFFLDCEDGMMYVGTKNFLKHGEVMPCLANKVSDGMLRWLEEYRDCLLSGKYKIRNDEGIRSISLFPETEPLCTEAVTSGVQVRCSAVLAPELSTHGDYLYGYSVRMRFLPVNGVSFTQCQLSKRHWIIKQDDVVVDELHGEAVVGMYPILKLGGDVFVYESCSTQPGRCGSLEGDFTFVPGSLTRQESAEFKASIAPFPLNYPEVIF